MIEGLILQKGMRIRVRRTGTSEPWLCGYIAIASENGKSIGAELELFGVNAGEVLRLLFLIDYDKHTVTSLQGGVEYDLEVALPVPIVSQTSVS